MTKIPRRAYFLAIFTLAMICLTLAQLWIVSAAHAPFLNLDFEVAAQNRPLIWKVGGSGFDFCLDTVERHSGVHSLRITNVSAARSTLATATQSFPLELVRGKRVRVSGWIKTANVHDGAAGIWWRVDGPVGTISLDNAPHPRLPPGNTDWTRFEFERDVSPAAEGISWGVFFRGEGAAWFDRVEIWIDGLAVDQSTSRLARWPGEGLISQFPAEKQTRH